MSQGLGQWIVPIGSGDYRRSGRNYHFLPNAGSEREATRVNWATWAEGITDDVADLALSQAARAA